MRNRVKETWNFPGKQSVQREKITCRKTVSAQKHTCPEKQINLKY
jgi:hypothetical protein